MEIVIRRTRMRWIGGSPRVPRHEERDLFPPPVWCFQDNRKRYRSKQARERRGAIESMASSAKVDLALAERMLKGEIPYKVTIDEDLVFTVPD